MRVLGVLAVLLLVAACGQPGSSTGRVSTPAPTGSPEALFAEVSAVDAVGGDPRHLQITNDVETGNPGCAIEASSRVEAVQDNAVYVQTTYTSTTSQIVGGCPDRGQLVSEVTIPALKGRPLIVNMKQWKVNAAGTGFERCDEQFGCAGPPRNHCDRAWLDVMLGATELEPERHVDVVACQDPWAVLDVDAVVTGCQSLDGATPPADCAGSGTHRRWFLHWAGTGWETVASGTAGGCTEAQQQAPAFPTKLCAGLTPKT